MVSVTCSISFHDGLEHWNLCSRSRRKIKDELEDWSEVRLKQRLCSIYRAFLFRRRVLCHHHIFVANRQPPATHATEMGLCLPCSYASLDISVRFPAYPL